MASVNMASRQTGADMSQSRAPLCGGASWLGLPVGYGVHGWITLIGDGRGLGVGIGCLAAAVVGLGLAVAARVRDERHAWLGIGGAVLSALPLKLYLLQMLFKL